MSERRLKHSRLISVVAATGISLACGTNYAYSAWAPAFAERMKLSSTQSNLVGTFGNLGMYTGGIPLGLLVDNYGPRPGALLGCVVLGLGYFAIHQAYKGGPGSIETGWLCFFAYLTGIGGCAAFSGAVKTSALNWPEYRGTATAFPIAAFGLSAFFFSSISALAFPDDTSDMLLLLSCATFGMILVGTFFLRVIPHMASLNDGETSTMLELTNSQESKLRVERAVNEPSPHESRVSDGGSAETFSLLSSSSESFPDDVLFRDASEKWPTKAGLQHPDIRGYALLSYTKFYQLFLMLGLLTGIGLMTINNIGGNARALWQYYDDSASSEFIQQRQLTNVEALSLMSFLGRLTSGVGSDLIVVKLGRSRYWCLFFSSSIFLIAQICAISIQSPQLLVFLSGLSGLGYGFLFGVFPTLVAEAFGVGGLSQNWGYITLSPVLFGNLFNLIYGHIYDQHSIILPNGQRDCSVGLECYRNAYLVTVVASLAGLGLSLRIIHHDWVDQAKHRKDRD